MFGIGKYFALFNETLSESFLNSGQILLEIHPEQTG